MALKITLLNKEGRDFVFVDTGPGIEDGDLNAALLEVKNEEALRELKLLFDEPRSNLFSPTSTLTTPRIK